MADLTQLTSAVTALSTASSANADRVAAKLKTLADALAAAQAAGVTIPDDLVAAIQAVTDSLNNTAV